ncbi:type II toxin-antitoxin system RelE/ParE family toxin [Candidatus Pacearchaeota archaeon]|nr:type II toxin-antitoxin system RelE/ParE family toxin [Candidatus Pacearchaeota archaeon]
MVKEIIRAPRFIQQIKKIDGSLIERVQKLIIKIINDPEIGKPMRFDRKGTREVYIQPFRLSYSFDKEKDVIYLLEIYHKDEQ